MTVNLIDKFKEIVGDAPVFYMRSSFSPLFCTVTWHEGPTHPMDLLTMCKGRDALMVFNEHSYVSIATDRLEEYFAGKISIKELEEEYYVWEKDCQALYDEMMQKDLKSLSDEDLKEYANKLNNLFLGLTRRTIYIENVDYDKVLKAIGGENKELLDTIWERATENAFLSFEGRHLKRLVDIAASNSANKVREAKFIFTDYYWTKSDNEIETSIKDLESNLPAKIAECEANLSKAAERKANHESWLSGLDQTSRRIAEYTQLVMLFRDIRKDPIAQIQAMSAELAVEMLYRAGIDTSMAPFIILYEYMEGVECLRTKKDVIEGRRNGCVYLAFNDGRYETENYDFDPAIKEALEFIEGRIKKEEVIKGQVACRGNVKGVARIIHDPTEDKGFQDGDILITSMTRPEFVPLMKRAGAVVTNEGGITCHAAIVSRELNIPCVIGTKIATQVLKDGDMIEVDATNGIVRIL